MSETSVLPDSPSLRQAIRPGIATIQLLWRPFVLIQLAALGVVVSYNFVPAVAGACEAIGEMKARYGYAFSAAAGILAGAVTPEIFKLIIQPGYRLNRARLRDLFLSFFYFGAMGMICDGLYRLFGIIYGPEASVRNAILKTLSDQFIFTPTLGTGIAAVYFPLYRGGWNFRKVFGGFGWNWYLRTVVPILLPAWCYWIPMCILLYALPLRLQVPFAACATAAWGLLLTALTANRIHTVDNDD